MYLLISRFCRDERGAALVEYGLLFALVLVVGVGALTLLGQEVSNAFSSLAAALGGI